MNLKKKIWILYVLIITFIVIIATCMSFLCCYASPLLASTDNEEVAKLWIFEWYWWVIIALGSIFTPLVYVLFSLIRRNRQMKRKIVAIKVEEQGVVVKGNNFNDCD